MAGSAMMTIDPSSVAEHGDGRVRQGHPLVAVVPGLVIRFRGRPARHHIPSVLAAHPHQMLCASRSSSGAAAISCFSSAESPIPKLFIDAEPAGFLIGPVREFCRAWPNQETITVDGAHFVQEDSPDAVGEATARFVAKVLAAGSASATTSSGRRT